MGASYDLKLGTDTHLSFSKMFRNFSLSFHPTGEYVKKNKKVAGPHAFTLEECMFAVQGWLSVCNLHRFG